MKFTINEIALLLGGTVEGDGNALIHDLSKIETGVSGTLSFLANPKYTPYIYQTGASAVLVSESFSPVQPLKTTLIRVKDPYSAFTLLLEKVRSVMLQKKGIEEPAFIHPDAQLSEDVYVGAFAYVGAGARIGKGVRIFPHTYVGDNCVIGDGSILFPGVRIYYGCRTGNNCIIHSGAVIGSDGFGFAPQENGTLKKIPQTGIVILEDEVEIGANTTIDRATLGETILRKGTKVDNLVQIAHNVEIGSHTVIASQAGISGSTKLGENCMVGGQVGIVGHIELADGTKIGAQSGVSKSSLTEGRVLRGSPAQDLRQQLKDEAWIRKISDLAEKISALEEKISNLEMEKKGG